MNDTDVTEHDGDWTTVFLSVPTPDASGAAKEATELAADAVRRACQHAGADAKDPWHVRVTEGRLAPTDDPAAIRRSVRRKLVGEVDALVALVRGASYGCGREVGWAVVLGIPTLLLHRNGAPLSAHAGGTPPESPVDVRHYDSPAELHDTARDWMIERKAMILAGGLRRTRPLAASEPLRRAAGQAWSAAGVQERRRVRDALLIGAEQMQALLENPLDFAQARSGLILDLLGQLGVVLPERMSTPGWYRRSEVPVLPEDAHEGLVEAIETWNWDGPKTLRAIDLGLDKLRHDRELVESGALQRSTSLANRFAWKKLLDEDHGPR